jgi:arylsulfatase A-like enzyme
VSRWSSCLATLTWIACSAETPPAPEPAATPRPNLVLVSIDTLRADHVGAYGYPRATTPRIDELAADSLRVATCVAQAPITLASHASILTSLLPLHHGASTARRTRLAPGVTTLAEVLRAEGYATASWNGGVQLDAAYGLDRGFDVYESARSHEAQAPALSGPEDRLRFGVDRAIEWLDGIDGPFFLFLHSYEIHHPYTPDPEFLALFETDYDGEVPEQVPVELLVEVNEGRRTLDAADVAQVVRSYDAELRSADAAFGRLVDHLKQRGLYDRTMIVLTSDHGEEFGEHGQVGWHAHTLYEELLRVPLVLKFPGSLHAGLVYETPARGIDVAPTALAALGVEVPPSFSGRVLRPGAPPAEAPPALSMHDTPLPLPLWALRVGSWKLRHVPAGEALYDLAADPAEAANLAAVHPSRAASLRRTGLSLLAGRPPPEAVAAPLDAETEARLRELGYIE